MAKSADKPEEVATGTTDKTTDGEESATTETTQAATKSAEAEQDKVPASSTLSSGTKEVTTVSIISVQTDEDTTTLITTVRPEIRQNNDDNKTEDNDISEETTTARQAADTTTESGGVHEFSCVEVGQDTIATSPDQIPMRCTAEVMAEEEKTPRQIYIVISKNQVEESQLFAKNVKVVVKDFMIMDVSPK